MLAPCTLFMPKLKSSKVNLTSLWVCIKHAALLHIVLGCKKRSCLPSYMMFTFGHCVVQAHFCGNFTLSLFYHKMIVVIVLCTTVLSRASTHTRASAHPPILTVLWFFEVLCVTTHHAKFLRIESEGRSAELTCTCSCDCALGATTSGIKVLHTPLHGLVRSVLSLQHEICILQAMTERCGNLATRLWVCQLCSTIQLSPLSGWLRRSTKRQCGTLFTSHPGWALAQEYLNHSSTFSV